jgi:hypothetical protein
MKYAGCCTDGGCSDEEALRGYVKVNESSEESGEKNDSWMEEYTEQQAYRNIGFGRDTGNAR